MDFILHPVPDVSGGVIEHRLAAAVVTDEKVRSVQSSATHEVVRSGGVATCGSPFLQDGTEGLLVRIVGRVTRDQNIVLGVANETI